MASKKSSRRELKAQASSLHLVDPLESATVTFACDLYPDYSASFIGSAGVIRSRSKSKVLKTKKRAA